MEPKEKKELQDDVLKKRLKNSRRTEKKKYKKTLAKQKKEERHCSLGVITLTIVNLVFFFFLCLFKGREVEQTSFWYRYVTEFYVRQKLF